MSTLLIDASVWVATTDSEDVEHVAARSLIESTRRLAALDFTLLEVGNAAARRWRDAGRATDLIRTVQVGAELIDVDPDVAIDAAETAVEHGLTTYDAAYVACARRRGLTLVSLDRRDLVSKGLAVLPSEVPA